MNDWTPKLNLSAPLEQLPLSPEEGFLLSRLDGLTPVRQLPALTGFSPERVQALLTRLVAHGAVLHAPTSAPTAPRVPPLSAPPPEEPPAEQTVELSSEDEAASEKEEPEGEVAAGNWRQIFERTLHPLPADERARRARASEDPELSAFCFDPRTRRHPVAAGEHARGAGARAAHRPPPPQPRGPGGDVWPRGLRVGPRACAAGSCATPSCPTGSFAACGVAAG